MPIALLRPAAIVLAAALPTLASSMTVRAAEAPPPGFAGAYLAGHIAERRGDSAVAADKLDLALRLAPDTPALRRRVVRLKTAEGDFAAAAAGAEALAAAGDDNFPVGLVRVVSRFASGDFAGAIALAEDPQAHGLSPILAILTKAWALAGSGDIDAGAKTLTDAGKENAGLNTLMTLHAGLMAEQAQRMELARWMYEEALAGSEKEGRKASPRLVRVAAGFFDRQGLKEQAEAVRAKATPGAVNPADTAAIGPIVETAAEGFAEALFNIAGSLQGDRQYRHALIYGRLSTVLRPASPATLFSIAQILESSGRYGAAAEAYGKVPPLGSFSWRSKMRAAESLSDAGDDEGAIATMRAVMEANPQYAAPAISLGHMLRGASRFTEAVAAYDEAANRKGGLGDSTEDAWLRYARGVALERSGDWTAAEKEFLKALETLSDEPLVLNYLGYTWIDRGEHLERARTMVARAVELRPDDGFIRDSLGWAEYRAGDFEAAVNTLERAVALQPLDPIINEHLGDAYWQVGRLREARFQWRRALSFEPEEKAVPIIEEKLRCGVDGCPAAAAPDPADGKKDGDGG